MSNDVKRMVVFAALATLALALVLVGQGMAQNGLTQEEELGMHLYFDANLSEPAGQSCASCHLPEAGFVDPDSDLPVSEGVIPGLFGGRNSPASAYAMYAPIRYFEEVEGLWIGGQFWDSRATGDVLGDPLADQALGPFLNPVEMANPDKATVVRDARSGAYIGLFVRVCGAGNLDNPLYVEAAYNCIAESIAAFERTELFGQFSSKYDYYLQTCLAAGGDPDDCAKGIGPKAVPVGEKLFSNKEWAGFQLFMDEEDGGAKCVLCHVADWIDPADYEPLTVQVPAWSPDGRVPPVFTDFTYDNLGVPVNPRIAELIGASQPTDLGLGAIVDDAEENGKFKVMTLRNIHLTAPYAHNGIFKKLEDITHFYNTRDVLPLCDGIAKPKPGKNCWDAPEVPETINVTELGNLGLSEDDEDALVKFMKTLSDGWTP